MLIVAVYIAVVLLLIVATLPLRIAAAKSQEPKAKSPPGRWREPLDIRGPRSERIGTTITPDDLRTAADLYDYSAPLDYTEVEPFDFYERT